MNASFYPVYSFDPSCTYGDNFSQQGAMIHEGIHAILTNLGAAHVYGYGGLEVAEAHLEANYSTYGALYNYPAALLACPRGWSLPEVDDWDVLLMVVGDSATAAIKLRTVSGWMSSEGIVNEDAYGFSALPSGKHATTDLLWDEFRGMVVDLHPGRCFQCILDGNGFQWHKCPL